MPQHPRPFLSNQCLAMKRRLVQIIALYCLVVAAVGCSESRTSGDNGRSTKDPSDRSVERTARTESSDVKGGEFGDRAARRSNGCIGGSLTPGVHERSLRHQGWERRYVLAIPKAPHGKRPAHPALIAMHGFGGNGPGMRRLMQSSRDRFEDTYVVVYPDGAGSPADQRGWNSGHPECCGTALHEGLNDVAFVRALVAQVAKLACLDLNRVYATGFSNGGDMAQRLACDASDIIAAASSVAGRFDYHATACPGRRAVPAALYRGRRDWTVPFSSHPLNFGAIETISAMQGFEQIARNHGCTGESQSTELGIATECFRFSNCDADFEVSLCVSADLGHCWPGASNCRERPSVPDEAFSASRHMRTFFTRHALSP